MSAIAPGPVDISHLPQRPQYIAFRTRRGGIWFGGTLVMAGPGTGEDDQPVEMDGVKPLWESEATVSTTSTVGGWMRPLSTSPVNGSQPFLSVTAPSTPLTLSSTGPSTPGLYSIMSPFSSWLSATPTMREGRSSPAHLVPLTPDTPSPPTTSTMHPRAEVEHLVKTYYGRVLRRYDTEAAAISEREYRNLVLREHSVSRKAYAFKRDALLRRRAHLVAELECETISPACSTLATSVGRNSSSLGVSEADTLTSLMGAVPRTISASIDSALFGLPQESVSPAINHSAAAYAYRATRRNGALHGHDVLVSPVGREVVVRAEHDIDEQWHGECDGEVVEAWLASLQSRDTCQPEADVSSEHRRRMESESEWSFLGTIDRAGSDRTASGILEMDTLLRGVPEILQAERLSSKGLLPQVQIGSDSRYTDLLHPEGVDQERQSSSAASPHLLAATWAPHPPATVDGEAMEHSKPNSNVL